MATGPAVRSVVVIPARNEERRIAACLQALAMQGVSDCGIILVANNCTDQTAQIAGATAAALGLGLDIIDCTLPEGVGVGTARRIGVNRGLAVWPWATEVLTTDADCLVAADWITRNKWHLQHAAAVCGLVKPMESELAVLAGIEIAPAEMEGRYERLVSDFYRQFMPGPFGLEGEHGCAAGASLAINVAAYHAIGGFADLATGEDRDLIRRLKAAKHPVRHAGDVAVAASCRLEGRADGGMAEALRVRAARTDYLIDDGLPPAQMLIDAAYSNSLGPWPLRVAPLDRLRAQDLKLHIALLEVALGKLAHAFPEKVPGQGTLRMNLS